MNAMQKLDYVVGLDLGQTQDFSAVAVLERRWCLDDTAGRLVAHYAVRHLHRWPLGTAYPVIVADVAALVATPPLDHPYLAIDQTGVGSAVIDMLRLARPKAALRPVLITAGHAVSTDEAGVFHVAKKELVGVVQVLMGQRRLQIADLPERDRLAKEMLAFKVKVASRGMRRSNRGESGTTTISSWRWRWPPGWGSGRGRRLRRRRWRGHGGGHGRKDAGFGAGEARIVRARKMLVCCPPLMRLSCHSGIPEFWSHWQNFDCHLLQAR
jgi:hypothetical protein